MDKPYIPILLGTARPNCYSGKVAEYIMDVLSKNDRAEIELMRVSEFMQDMTIPPWQEEENHKTKEWRNTAEKADAFIIVAPEYNHGYPGELKMVLDQDLGSYKGKPVLTCGVSAGGFGGTRVVEHILAVYNELGLVNVPYPLYFSKVHNLFDEKSREKIDEKYEERIENSFNKLLLYQKHLQGLPADLK